MATQVQTTKSVNETLSLEFDMLSRLVVGESVSTAVCTCIVLSGVDELPDSMLSGLASVSNNVVTQKVTGGTAGVIYKISCAIRTSSNNILINESKLAVLSDSAAIPA